MTVQILAGDCREVLRGLPAESVQCCVTSPPYFGLRDYGAAGQIGLERTPDEYVARLVAVFRELRRVLRTDGTLWLNLGDCYATGAGKVGERPGGGRQGDRWKGMAPITPANRLPLPGIKTKDLIGIPWMVAFALRADGWYLRSEIIWDKPNAMPESVSDRPTKAHEHIFLLTRSEAYYYDADAIREPHLDKRESKAGDRAFRGQASIRPRGNFEADSAERYYHPAGRNRRTVWKIPTRPFKGAHFATFPPKLVEPCILAGSRPGDMVLDPFAGAGTTGLVAHRLGRSFVGIDLNPDYAQMARDRIRADAPLLTQGVA